MEKIGEAAGIRKAVDLNGLLPFFTNDIMCNIVSGKLFKEEGWNKLFPRADRCELQAPRGVQPGRLRLSKHGEAGRGEEGGLRQSWEGEQEMGQLSWYAHRWPC